MLRRLLVASLLFGLAGCAPEGFVASEADLATYAGWTRFDRGDQPVGPEHPAGGSVVYVSRLPVHGATAFAEGTMIVRITAGASPDPTTWEVHAMAKRGGDYNAAGARGWEFFDLELEPSADGSYRPHIEWRGESPPEGNGYEAPDGGGVELSCNHCHGAAVQNDSVLGPELDLTTF
ncbi:MAG: hypothetical protein K1X94_21725 [Sandaracinaceae bacterium]|nr:hypothetical protein [Sandaracinaceae bacterium]